MSTYFKETDTDGDWWADKYENRTDVNLNGVHDTEDINSNGILDPSEDTGLMLTRHYSVDMVASNVTYGSGNGKIDQEATPSDFTSTSKYHINTLGGSYDDEDDECYRIDLLVVEGTHKQKDWSKGGKQW
jgi:hypothetical protein